MTPAATDFADGPLATKGQTATSRILWLLTRKVRVLADHQVPAITSKSARALMKRLDRQGLLDLRKVMVLPELPLASPLFSWRPGNPPPHAERLAWQLASRWIGRPSPVLVGTATLKARLEYGGCLGGRPLRRTEVSHDLHVTALYLKWSALNIERARLWQHEDALLPCETISGLIPDAMLGGLAIEFGGKYRAQKLRLIHQGHSADGRAYEIW